MRSSIVQQLMRRSLVAALAVTGSVNAVVALPAHAARVRQQAPAVISGVVMDARSRQPVSGASVIVVRTRLGVGHCRSFNVGCVREPAKLRRGEMPMESVLVLFPR